ncbi:FAD-dependent oxidoreductase [Streptomyces sp. SID4919]|uniref:FAD-dependent monooxygenase n=1 Tax=unclassified Streptomyces TaxID=2593676 RepID=UPI000823812A|nr:MULTISPECIES: FAD-dependent monooxygenase [unclassified Streptomyces]MYY13853.1 FAD-dependent oxidoreductase [Streptomyces sp. SID4919]SCK30975.1 Dehydrogenase (flavoprotein) [Streptomyces sp. AmelKG-E11A]
MTTEAVPGDGHRPPHGSRYDAVVAGGGPAGAAAAITLARSGRSVLLADARSGPPKTSESLVPAARTLLQDLGVEPRALDPDHRPCHGGLSAWGSPRVEQVCFINDPYGHGWQLDRTAFDRLLRSQARARGAEVAEHTTVGRPVREPDGGWRLTVTARGTCRTVRCRWLVDATGRRARIAVHCGARRRRYDQLVAVHLRFVHDPYDCEELSVVESVRDGWWYTAPCHPLGRDAVYFTDTDLVPPGLTTTQGFLDQLAATRHTGSRAEGRRPWPGGVPRRGAAHTARLEPAAGDGWIAVGDAATAYDPISSQGVLTALYTGKCAGEAVDARLADRRDAVDTYLARLDETFDGYRTGHRTVHSWEQRWADHPFWQRRHAPVPAPTAGTGPLR